VSDDESEVLAVCGASGTGKTVTMWEIGHRLRERGVPHALVDTDELDRVWPQPEPVEALIAVTYRHLRTMWETFSGLGTRHLVLCGVMASIAQSQESIAEAIPGATTTYVRLSAEHTTRERRLRGRTLGSGFDQEMHASDLAAAFIKEHDQPGMPTVATDGKTVAEVADEVLRIAGW
jgi:ABC-type dipeptide/oligopeptide/nickel transport system ATPase component